jgi:hypothetical protein
MNPGLFIALWFIINALAVGLYDIYAFWFLPPDQSVSHWVQAWLTEFPVFALAIGVVGGHLFWPIARQQKGG